MCARLSTFGYAAILILSTTGFSHAFVALGLTPATPMIESGFVTVDYVGNNSGGVLTASGFANTRHREVLPETLWAGRSTSMQISTPTPRPPVAR